MVTGRAPVKLPFPPKDFRSLTPREQESLYLDFQALADQAEGTRWATLVIAPSDATTASKNKADYVCTGVNDNVKLQAACDAITNRAQVGKIVILEGNLFVTTQVLVQLGTGQMLTIEGMGATTGGASTIINGTGSIIKVNGGFLSGGGTILFKGIGFIAAGGGDCIQSNAGAAEIDGCSFTTSGIGAFLDGGLSGPYIDSYIHDSYFACESRAVEIRHQFGARIINNKMMTSETATTIRSHADAAATGRLLIANNDIAGVVGIWLNDSTDGTFSQDTLIVGNRFQTSINAVQANATANTAVLSNTFRGCGRALDVGSGFIQGDTRGVFANNFVYGTTGTRAVKIGSSTIGTTDWSVMFNKFYGGTPQYTVEIGGSTANNCVAFNDYFQAYVSAALLDNGTNTRTEDDFLPSLLDVNARVAVRVNSGGVPSLRRRINFIPGSADVTLAQVDDSGNEEVDVTIGLNTVLDVQARVGVRKNSTGSTLIRRRMNLIEGSGITLAIADDAVDEEVDITISVSAGSGSGDEEGVLYAVWDGLGSTVDVNKTVDIRAPFAGTIDSWEIFLDTATTVSIDVWKDVYANYPPTAADKISASDPIATSAADHATDSTLTGWSTTVTEGDILRLKPSAVGVATKIYVCIHYTRP